MVVIFHRGSKIFARHLYLTIGDWAIIIFSQLAAVFIRLGWVTGAEYLGQHWGSLVAAVAIYFVVFYAGGMYEPPSRSRRLDFDFLPLIVTVVATGITGLLLYARPQMTLGRGIWGISSLLILCLAYASRRFFLALVRKGFFLRPALLICDHPDRASDLLKLLENNPASLYQVAGLVTCGVAPMTSGVGGLPFLGRTEELGELVEAHNASAILLAVSPMRSHELLPHLRPLRYAGVEIMDFISLSEELAGEIPLAHINDEWLMTAALNSSVVRIRKVKRAMDVFVSLIGLIPGIPLILLSGLLIRLTSPGPIIYRQRREGLGGRPYVLFKLRTMRTDAEAGGAVWSRAADSRVTRVGYYLRKWRIDELPQLFNVIRGEMSLVGPRPERPEFTEKLAAFIPFYNERNLVQPGITGWAQINYPYAASMEAAARKLQFDLFYIKNMSFWMDMAILLRTFKTIIVGLRHEGDVSFMPVEDHFDVLRESVEPATKPPAPGTGGDP